MHIYSFEKFTFSELVTHVLYNVVAIFEKVHSTYEPQKQQSIKENQKSRVKWLN